MYGRNSLKRVEQKTTVIRMCLNMLSLREPRVQYETQCPITMITVKNQIFFKPVHWKSIIKVAKKCMYFRSKFTLNIGQEFCGQSATI